MGLIAAAAKSSLAEVGLQCGIQSTASEVNSMWYQILYHLLKFTPGHRQEQIMVITASQARAQLFPLIEQVNNDSTPIIITSKKGNVVLVSESEWDSIVETMYLLRSPGNREHLAKGRADIASGNLFEIKLPIHSASQGVKVSRSTKKRAPAKKVLTAKKIVMPKKKVKKASRKSFA